MPKTVTEPFRNGPVGPQAPYGQPVSASNAGMMRGVTVDNERYSMGRVVRPFAPTESDSPAVRFSAGKRVKSAVARVMAKVASLRLELEKEGLVGSPLPFFKEAKDREPTPPEHASAPSQKLRPRSEVIVVGKEGDGAYILAIDKGDYLLFPGGGIPEGEQSRDAVIRETMEESGHNLFHIEPSEVVESIWPPDFPGAAKGFDGERTYFFSAMDGGDGGGSHPDREAFQKMPIETVLKRLDELITDDDQLWAQRNNECRRDIITHAREILDTAGDHFKAKKIAAAPGVVPKVEGIPLDPATKFVNAMAQKQTQLQQAPAASAAPAVPAMKTAQASPVTAPPVELDEFGMVPGYAHSRLMPAVNDNSLRQAQADADAKAVRQQKILESTQRRPALPHQAHLLKKQGDAVVLQPKQEHILFTPEGKLIARRGNDRRFDLPVEGRGRPAPYEDPVSFVPETGVPDPGIHGYRIGMHTGEADIVPEGYESWDPDEALKELYASMGLAKNRPYRNLDRARARVIVRAMRARRAKAAERAQQLPGARPAPVVTDTQQLVADEAPPVTPE